MFIDRLKGHDYIDATRKYLDYLEEHLNNVAKAFDELSRACEGMHWVSSDYDWHSIKHDVYLHDLSKFSPDEFVQYRAKFYPVKLNIPDCGFELEEFNKDFDLACAHHKKHNSHHWESIKYYRDFIHMIIDWTAMSYKFGDTPWGFYEKNKSQIKLPSWAERDVEEIFERLRKYRGLSEA